MRLFLVISSCSRKFQSLIWHEVCKIFDLSYIKVSLTNVHGKISNSNWPHGGNKNFYFWRKLTYFPRNRMHIDCYFIVEKMCVVQILKVFLHVFIYEFWKILHRCSENISEIQREFPRCIQNLHHFHHFELQRAILANFQKKGMVNTISTSTIV